MMDQVPKPIKPGDARPTEFHVDQGQSWKGSAILDTVTLEEGVCVSDERDALSDAYRILTCNINGRRVEIIIPVKPRNWDLDPRWLSPYAYRTRVGNVLRWCRFDGRGRSPEGL